ncbi:MAG: hypothetical protein KIT00_03730, partial [Rhodospirillales bacterium]|nr:hypothetical protein [Rhodospirillales bacterium]
LAIHLHGSYIRVGGVKVETSTDAFDAGIGISEALNEEIFEVSFFDPERNRETIISVEKFIVKKGIIFSDKNAYRVGFTAFTEGNREHKGYIVGRALPEVLTRSLAMLSRNFKDPLYDEQTSMLALQRS